MALSDITRDAVLQAMDEYDELGADAFLTKYGFAPAKLYRVTEHGRQYDSKAIVGVAHGYATGQFWTASDFSGGQQTVVKTLEALGFSFAPATAENTRAWLVTTKSDYRRLGGSTKYDDDPTSHYSYDSNVANSRQLAVGDRLVFWKYGAACAFSGPAPAEALEACHLYSYAEVGRHDDEGGLLLRRDLHRLFDQGLLAVTADGTIDVANAIKKYDLYSGLHGQQLKVSTTARQRDWLALHWDEWRTM